MTSGGIESVTTTPGRESLAGTAALLAGVALLVLNGLEEVNALRSFPRFWHHNRELWWLMSLALPAWGTWLLMQARDNDPSNWKPSERGIRFRELRLYTREGCHLCDDARELLDAHQRWLPRVLEIDIDADPRLVEEFGRCVPVVTLDGKVRFRGRISRELLRRLIEGTPAN